MAWNKKITVGDSPEGSASPCFTLSVDVEGGYPFLYEGRSFVNTASCMDMVVFPDETEADPGETVVRRASVSLVFRCAKARDDMLEWIEEDLYDLEGFEASKDDLLCSEDYSSGSNSSV